MTIPKYNEKEGGKRDYRKTNYCLVCKRSFTSKISAHYINIHYNHEKVKRAMLCPTGSKERKIALLELENRGNFVHNVAVSIEFKLSLIYFLNNYQNLLMFKNLYLTSCMSHTSLSLIHLEYLRSIQNISPNLKRNLLFTYRLRVYISFVSILITRHITTIPICCVF